MDDAQVTVQRADIEKIVNVLTAAQYSSTPLSAVTFAAIMARNLIPDEQRVLDPQPYTHQVYGDRSEVPLGSFVFRPRAAYVLDPEAYPFQNKNLRTE